MYINYLAATDYIDPSVFFGLAIIPVLTDWYDKLHVLHFVLYFALGGVTDWLD